MLLELRNVDWQSLYSLNNNVNQAWSFMKLNLQTIYDKHAPMHEKRIKGRNCPWLTNDITNDVYKKQKNKCTNLIRKASGKCKQPQKILEVHQEHPFQIEYQIFIVSPVHPQST